MLQKQKLFDLVSQKIKATAAEEKRIQQQILVQQKKELTTFLDTQKKQYRLCRERMKEVWSEQSNSTGFFLSTWKRQLQWYITIFYRHILQ